MRARAERQDLERHRGVIRYLDKVVQLLPDDVLGTYGTAQRALVNDCPHLRWVWSAEDFLPADPQLAPPRDLLFAGRGALPDQRARIPFSLKQSGHDLDLVGPDNRCRRLQAYVRLQPGRQDIRVGMPPPGRVRLPGQVQQRGTFFAVGHAVERNESAPLALLKPHPPLSHPP